MDLEVPPQRMKSLLESTPLNTQIPGSWIGRTVVSLLRIPDISIESLDKS